MELINLTDINNSQRGVSILIAIMALLVLSALGLAIISMTSMEKMINVNYVNSSKALYIAEAGIERGARAVRDDASAAAQTGNPAQNGYYAATSIDATNASGTAPDPEEVLEYEKGNCSVNSDNYVEVSDFRQVANLLCTRLNKVEIGCRFDGHKDGQLEVKYTTNNWSTEGATNAQWVSHNWTTNYLDITGDLAWDCSIINNSGFKIRVTARDKKHKVDYLFIRITHKIDASTEPWYSTWRNLDSTGSAKTANIILGIGKVSQMPVYDEAGKVNLNYSTQTLLSSILQESGVPGGDSTTIAAAMIAYRSGNWFDTIEEIKQVAGMTDSYYDLVKDYITVYSYVNTDAQRPAGSRAPININTAPKVVLKAIFNPVNGISSSEADSLANDVIIFRNTTPFTCLYTSDDNVETSFAYFLEEESDLDGDERDNALENADASDTDWDGDFNNVITAEFCYSSKVFSVVATGTVDKSVRVVKRVFEDSDENSDGIFNIPAHTTLNYWKELSP